MTAPPVRGPAGLAWRCDGCGRTSMWTGSHMVYGSIRDEDKGRWERLIVTCSPECLTLTEMAGRQAGFQGPKAVA